MSNSQTKSVSVIAREALLAMAKDGVTPTPSNYKKYYETVSGSVEIEPSAKTLKKLKSKLEAQSEQIPDLVQWKEAIDIALIKRDWENIENLLFNIISKSIKRSETSEFNSLLYILESFTHNLEELFPENSTVKSQVEIIKDLLKEPKRKDKLSSARRALLKIKAPDSLKAQLDDARLFAKKLALEFVKQVESTGDVTDTVLQKFESHQEDIEKATTHDELIKISQRMIAMVSEAKSDIQVQHDSITKNIHQAKLMSSKIQELELQLQAASEAAKQDYLTGLMNRRGLEEKIEMSFSDYSELLTVAVLDIDNFKQLNDSLGHAAGDKALKHLANAINLCVGDKGSSARLGGEEFVVLFPNMNSIDAKIEMEKLQRLLTKEIFMSDNEKRIVTFSAGVATREEKETPDELLSRADEAMYIAKKTGKNKVIIA